MTKTRTSIQIGQQAEDEACNYLQKQGYSLLERNYRCKMGEIDLIMKDNTCIVFVEVRLRNNPRCGNALDSVDLRKQKKLTLTATHYLCQKKWFDKVNCRFDVIGISYSQMKASLQWIKNAFSAYHF
ncbi:MAG: YraN family protein [Gammaproteobacteria bacterium]|nr:YraN family protein [Gammaproteobacteria bacterium]